MNDIGIFILGLLITLVTLSALILVGRSEAQDPALNRTGFSKDED